MEEKEKVFDLKDHRLREMAITVAVAPPSAPDIVTWRDETKAWRVWGTHNHLIVTRDEVLGLYLVTHRPTGRWIAGGFEELQRAAAFCDGLSRPELSALWDVLTVESFEEALTVDLEDRLLELVRAARDELGMKEVNRANRSDQP